MDEKEAYQVLQAAWVKKNDVRVGDEVEVLRPNEHNELGSGAAIHWQSELDGRGKRCKIDGIEKRYINAGGWMMPFHVLEIINQPRKKKSTINWITQEQAREAAKKGDIEAVQCSLVHHKQILDASPEELGEAIDKGLVTVSAEHCACCKRGTSLDGESKKCYNCPLGGKTLLDNNCCSGIWSVLDYAFSDFKKDKNEANHQALHEQGVKMCAFISEKLAELKKPKITYSTGDRFKHKRSEEKYMLAQARGDKISIVSLTTGHYYGIDAIKVCDMNRITQDELEGIIYNPEYNLTRYWDDRLKVYTDGRDSEDLTRTEIDGFVLECINDRVVIGGRRFLIYQAKKFHQELGQIIATAKRREGKEV